MPEKPSTPHPDRELLRRYREAGTAVRADADNPLGHAMGLTVEYVDFTSGDVRLAFEPPAWLTQGSGVLQGGAVTAMLDFAMAYASLAVVPAPARVATTNLSVAFQRAAMPVRLLAIGQIERAGRSMVFTRAELRQAADEKLVATATSTLVIG